MTRTAARLVLGFSAGCLGVRVDAVPDGLAGGVRRPFLCLSHPARKPTDRQDEDRDDGNERRGMLSGAHGWMIMDDRPGASNGRVRRRPLRQ